MYIHRKDIFLFHFMLKHYGIIQDEYYFISFCFRSNVANCMCVSPPSHPTVDGKVAAQQRLFWNFGSILFCL